MSKKHDENKDLRSVSRIARINYSDKTIRAAKGTLIGIHMWGKIDFLTHYCKWHFIWDNKAGIGGFITDSNEVVKPKNTNSKKAAKQHNLTDKTKKQSKKK